MFFFGGGGGGCGGEETIGPFFFFRLNHVREGETKNILLLVLIYFYKPELFFFPQPNADLNEILKAFIMQFTHCIYNSINEHFYKDNQCGQVVRVT